MDWTSLIYFIAAGGMLWLIVRMVKGSPQAFSRANLSNSIFTFGILALILIAIIFICIQLLKH